MTDIELERVANRLTIAAAGITLFYTGYKAAGVKGALATTVVPIALLWVLNEVEEAKAARIKANAENNPDNP